MRSGYQAHNAQTAKSEPESDGVLRMSRRTKGKKFEEGILADEASARTAAACEREEVARMGPYPGPTRPSAPEDNPQSD